MHTIRLALIFGFLCCGIPPGHASEEGSSKESPEAQEPCELKSDENCTAVDDKEELERGFDPCLINANLPAGKSEPNSKDSGADEKKAEAQETDDSGGVLSLLRQ